jgi:hypothetical protein
VIATLIDRLPDEPEGDPQRSREEMIARNVVFAAYVGTCRVVYVANLGRPTD